MTKPTRRDREAAAKACCFTSGPHPWLDEGGPFDTGDGYDGSVDLEDIASAIAQARAEGALSALSACADFDHVVAGWAAERLGVVLTSGD